MKPSKGLHSALSDELDETVGWIAPFDMYKNNSLFIGRIHFIEIVVNVQPVENKVFCSCCQYAFKAPQVFALES